MLYLVFLLLLYALGLVLTAVGSRLAGRCATWCCALFGFPHWVVAGTVVGLCAALPQLLLAFLAAGLSATGLAVGVALAGAVTDLGLALALFLLRRRGQVAFGEFTGKCALLAAAALVLALFVRDGALSYTGTGLLMALFVVFVLHSIGCRYAALTGGAPRLLALPRSADAPQSAAPPAGTGSTGTFPVMSVPNALRNLGGVLGGLALLALGARALLASAGRLAAATGTIQALWAATLISFGFCLPLLAEVLEHPFGTVWKVFSERCRYYPAASLPIQLLNSAILNLTLALPLSSLMYRAGRLPVGAQFRRYDVPLCLVLALVLGVPPLAKKRLYRWQGAVCLALYGLYLGIVLLAPNAGA